jgi:uncharacterized protein YbjT (DUF2867 family)
MITVLAASGATGLELTRQALERGHRVRAIARDPRRITLPDSPLLTRVPGDVTDPESIAAALAGNPATGTLIAGARAVVAARPEHIIWLGAFGTGPSAAAAGPLTRTLLRLALGREIPEKVEADATILAAGGTVFHAAMLTGGPLSATRRTVPLSDSPRALLPGRVSRATVAAAMLDEAEAGTERIIEIALPLSR